MSALNTLKGQMIKDYQVKYKEKLPNGLWFYIIYHIKYITNTSYIKF